MEKRQFARIAKALADPRRYEILSRIASQEELSCACLREKLPITAATLSHHLKELASAGLIEVRRDSKYVHLQLCRPMWKAYLKELQKITA
jgi:ArsR family transcriptional regulator, arsenate/arsenite/antimonite-responsive transcriptional repressor